MLTHPKHTRISADHGNALMHLLLYLNVVIIEEEHRHFKLEGALVKGVY